VLILDTNVYIDAAQDADQAARISDIVDEMGDSVGLHSVVVAELLAGGPGQGERAALAQHLRHIAEDLITPSHDDWAFAGNAVRILGGDSVTTRRSFWNDLLIATSCARTGAILLTSNKADFARIRRVVPVDMVALRN